MKANFLVELEKLFSGSILNLSSKYFSKSEIDTGCVKAKDEMTFRLVGSMGSV